MDPFPYWIGYDTREKDAFDVCSFSCQRKTTHPLVVRALKHKELRTDHTFTRKWMTDENGRMIDAIDGRPFSTEFAFTRFLVPYLQRYKGWALFTDCDVLWLDDIAKLIEAVDDRFAVMCVKHNHIPRNKVKMDGQAQQPYPRKNWSSVMLWNCGHPANRALTPQYVNTATGGQLHGFEWLKDEEIGGLEHGWNFLVGHTPASIKPRVMHFTDGGPWFENMMEAPYAGWWMAEFDHMLKEKGKFE